MSALTTRLAPAGSPCGATVIFFTTTRFFTKEEKMCAVLYPIREVGVENTAAVADRGDRVNQVSRTGEAPVAMASWRPSQNSSIIFLLNAGISSGLRLVTNPLSTTTSSFTHFPPAFLTSFLIAGHEVSVLPRTTPASISTHGP